MPATPDLAIERPHLAKAERDAADGEARVRRQVEMAEHLHAAGHDAGEAEALLRNLRQTLLG